MNTFLKASESEMRNAPFAIVTIIKTEGTVPRKTGRMTVLSDGSSAGTIGGGTIERDAKEAAVAQIKEGKCKEMTIKGERGSVDIFIDVPIADKNAIIVGSGHVGRAVEKILSTVSWKVTVLERDVNLERILKENITKNTAIIITGAWGREIEKELLKTDAFYIGILAAKNVKGIRDKRIYSPIGLNIGAESPEEIALAVCSEIIAVYNSKKPSFKRDDRRVLVRGAGDLATAVIVRLFKAGYAVAATETARPTVIRRTVSLASAVYDGKAEVEGVRGILVNSTDQAVSEMKNKNVPIIIDEGFKTLEEISPTVLVDAIIAKKNLGLKKGLAPFVVALGPGFTAPKDADVVIETQRGHNLGRLIYQGSASENTGVPGLIAGYGKERVIHSPCPGVFKSVKRIGDIVKKGEVIATVGKTEVTATIDGMLRGLLHDELKIKEGFKIADIDPRGEKAEFLTISDKGRTISGAVLEAIDCFYSL